MYPEHCLIFLTFPCFFGVFSTCLLEQKIHLVSTGEGPVVYARPSKIDFGNIQVLQDATRILNLSNQAVIPASFWAEMVSAL